MESVAIHTVVLFSRPHIDPICALFLLREFGEKSFPGVKDAKLEFWNGLPDERTADDWEKAGYLLLDMGRGKFDHHQDAHDVPIAQCDCAATLVAKFLQIDRIATVRKILQFAKRDDLEGKGIISQDVIDRTFGLPAIVMNLNRDYPEHPEFVVDMVYRILLAHYHEEYRRKVLMPREWQELKDSGKASRLMIPLGDHQVLVALVESDSKTIAGFLRAVKDIQADIVVQRTSSGHTNIITSQKKVRLDLKKVARLLRQAEAAKKDIVLQAVSDEQWERPGRMEEIPEWYFDTAANTLQNGGASSDGVPVTHLSLSEIGDIVQRGLSVV